MPVINYKKLKRAQDASAPAAPAGASGRDPMAAGAPPPGGAAAMRMGDGLAPGDGAGNHMAAVIRRIEGFYSAPRFDDSDEDEETRGDADDDADDAPDAPSSDDDDFEDDGRDPNDPAVIQEKEERRVRKLAEAEERAKNDAERGKNDGDKTKPKKKSVRPPEEWYDMDDDFIDDDELDEYFERNGRKDKLGGSGGDRFYVNKGDLEFVDDGTGAANALRRARAAARFGHAGGREWSEEDMNALRAGVAKHGRRWRTIKNDETFGAALRDFSVDSLKNKWLNMIKRGQAPGGANNGVDGTNGAKIDGHRSSNGIHPTAPGDAPPERGADDPRRVSAERLRGDETTNGSAGVPPTTTPSPPGGDAGARRAAAAADVGSALAQPQPQPQTFGVRNPDGTRRVASDGLGKDGVYSAALTAALEAARAATARETPPEKGSRARLPDAIVAELERIVLICKGPGGEPQASLPRGILKELMSFLDPFCSPVTLQKRMSAMSEAVARERAPPEEPDASRGAVY